MIGQPHPLNLAEIELQLLPGLAVYWPQRNALLVADLHLGKAEAFRRDGIAVPEGDTAKTLQRLGQLIQWTQASELILLGDTLHARLPAKSSLPMMVEAWRAGFNALNVLAIAGNHDGDLERYRHCFEIQPEGLVMDGLTLLHHPPETAGTVPWIAGHWHPVAPLAAGGDRLRLPAFIEEQSMGLVLPAFGGLTGGLSVPTQKGRRRWVSSGEKIFALDQRRAKKSRH